ncbi:RxLR effector protein [Phytophthora megakarya]|uniref:RxLR effector protein n=1 Tax=Phytophthora megakarya TaxID=4795 RepID=A0A225WDD5_9STRA|nr:RxLR effector protein [Phytophthora megakarya]
MRLNYLAVVVSTTLMANITATWASTSTNVDQISLTKVDPIPDSQKDSSLKSSLRVHNTEGASDDGINEEERLFGNLKYKAWFKSGMNPMKLYKKLGLEGLGQDAYKHKEYAE